MGQALLIVCRLPEQMYMLNPLSIELPSAQKPTLRLALAAWRSTGNRPVSAGTGDENFD
jgi:hypothetical protein